MQFCNENVGYEAFILVCLFEGKYSSRLPYYLMWLGSVSNYSLKLCQCTSGSAALWSTIHFDQNHVKINTCSLKPQPLISHLTLTGRPTKQCFSICVFDCTKVFKNFGSITTTTTTTIHYSLITI